MLWEAGDRVCGKRLKALIPILIDAMQRHGHLELDPVVQDRLLQVSAATIDRALCQARTSARGGRRRRTVVNVIRRQVPVRTFSDRRTPPPGFFEVDMVEHCGGMKTGGDFVHTLTLTDIANGWTCPHLSRLCVVQDDTGRLAADGQSHEAKVRSRGRSQGALPVSLQYPGFSLVEDSPARLTSLDSSDGVLAVAGLASVAAVRMRTSSFAAST